MSSYLSKSKQAFKPKIPSRRAGAGALAASPTPVRSSVERQPSQLQTTPTHDLQPSSPPPSSHHRLGDETPHRAEGPGPQQSTSQQTQDDDGGVEERRRSRGTHRARADTAELPETSTAHARSHRLPSPSPTQQTPHVSDAGPSTARAGEQQASLKRRRDGTNGTNTGELLGTTIVEDTEETRDAASARNTRPSKKSRIERLAASVVAAAIGSDDESEDDDDETRTNGTTPRPSSRTRIRRVRAPTPDGADRVEIAPTVVTMSELTKDRRQGKKSGRELRLQERDAAAAAQRKESAKARARQQAGEFMHNPEALVNGQGAARPGMATSNRSNPTALPSPAPTPALLPPRLAGPRVRVVNGQIVQDEDSRVLDRHAATAVSNLADEAVEEDELTRHVNSGSYMRRERHTKWTESETERFYQGLRWFGTDFQTIAHMFPGRSRRQIKLKFNKEERNPSQAGLVQKALMEDREECDLKLFEEYAGYDLRDPEEHEKDLNDDRLELEKAQAEETAAMQAIVKEREEAAAKEAEAYEAGMVAGRQGGQADAAAAGPSTSTPATNGAAPANGTAHEQGLEEDVVEETDHLDLPESNHDIIAGKRTRGRPTATGKGKGKAAAGAKGKSKEAEPAAKGKPRSKVANLSWFAQNYETDPSASTKGAQQANETTANEIATDISPEPEETEAPPTTKKARGGRKPAVTTQAKRKAKEPAAPKKGQAEEATAAKKGKAKAKASAADKNKPKQPSAPTTGTQHANEAATEEMVAGGTVVEDQPEPEEAEASSTTRKARGGRKTTAPSQAKLKATEVTAAKKSKAKAKAPAADKGKPKTKVANLTWFMQPNPTPEAAQVADTADTAEDAITPADPSPATESTAPSPAKPTRKRKPAPAAPTDDARVPDVPATANGTGRAPRKRTPRAKPTSTAATKAVAPAKVTKPATKPAMRVSARQSTAAAATAKAAEALLRAAG